MNTVYEELNDPGLEAWVVLWQDSQFNSPTEGYCKQYLATHPMSMKLLYDPQGGTEVGIGIYGEMETSLVTNEDGRIVAKFLKDSPGLIRTAILQELVDVDNVCMQTSECASGQGCVPLPEPIQGHDVHVCAPFCDLTGADTCPAGTLCTQLQEGQDNGACLPTDLPAAETP